MNHNHYSHNDLPALTQIKENRGWFLALGVALVVVGMFALFFVYTSTLVSVVYLGALLTIAGIFEGIKAFKITRWSSFFLHLFLAILYIVMGIFLMLYPAVNAAALTLLLGVFFVASGIFKIVFSLISKVLNKNWILVNGIIALILGLLILYEWPYSSVWVLGTFLAIDLIFTGWTWIMLALMAKKLQ